MRRRSATIIFDVGRCNPLVRAMYQRLLAAGKSKMSALGAAMRKLVHIAFGVLKHQKPFDPNVTA